MTVDAGQKDLFPSELGMGSVVNCEGVPCHDDKKDGAFLEIYSFGDFVNAAVREAIADIMKNRLFDPDADEFRGDYLPPPERVLNSSTNISGTVKDIRDGVVTILVTGPQATDVLRVDIGTLTKGKGWLPTWKTSGPYLER